jgi:hypothetical protein
VRSSIQGLLLCLIILSVGCTCGNQVLTEQDSPDGRYVAALFERNCGATTDYVIAVNIRDREESLAGTTSDDVLLVSGLPSIEIRWEGPRQLVVQLPVLRGTEQVYRRTSSWRDVAIAYRQVSRTSGSAHY